MIRTTVGDAARAMGGTVSGPDTKQVSDGCIDSRRAAPGKLFFALPGERTDGHEYVRQALAAGAEAAVVDRDVDEHRGTIIRVDNVLLALAALARSCRAAFTGPVVAVTGSVGKTTTKELITAAVRTTYTTLSSSGNYNNELGLPLTLLQIDSSHTALVLEMGMRGAGQIAALCDIALPTVGVITNIGVSHIEILGSQEAIFNAKTELLQSLPPEGLAVVPALDEFSHRYAQKALCSVVTFGSSPTADYAIADLDTNSHSIARFLINGHEMELSIAGAHNAVNAAAACAVARHLRVPWNTLVAQLGTAQLPPGRTQLFNTDDGTTIIDDTYNAAPDSMVAALAILARTASGSNRAVAVLGEMRELGNFAEEAHRVVGRSVGTAGVDFLITAGDGAAWIAEEARRFLGASNVCACADTESAAAAALEFVKPGDIVLVKGSRALAMETVVQALVDAHSASPDATT